MKRRRGVKRKSTAKSSAITIKISRSLLKRKPVRKRRR